MCERTNPISAYLITIQDMAHSTNIPEPERDRATTFNCQYPGIYGVVRESGYTLVRRKVMVVWNGKRGE